MPSARQILFLLALPFCAQASLAASSQPEAALGTLLFSPTERAAITAARDGKTATTETPSGLRLGGIVKRSSGKGTVWMNQRPVAEGLAIPPASAPQITADGVTIDGKPVRVGETLNLVTGERNDLVPPGSVSTGKAK